MIPLSREFLLARGYCCHLECKNCPYKFMPTGDPMWKCPFCETVYFMHNRTACDCPEFQKGILNKSFQGIMLNEKTNTEHLQVVAEPFTNYTPPSWDEYFVRMFYLVATKSKDPRTKIGAILVKNKRIISTGYNGICICVDDTVPERSERPEKYKWYEHAERNCVFSAALIGIPTLGSTMYTNGTPCADCTRAVVQAGISKVVVHKTYEELFYQTVVAKNANSQWTGHDDASHQMLREAGVELVVWDGYLGVEAYMDGKKFIV